MQRIRHTRDIQKVIEARWKFLGRKELKFGDQVSRKVIFYNARWVALGNMWMSNWNLSTSEAGHPNAHIMYYKYKEKVQIFKVL